MPKFSFGAKKKPEIIDAPPDARKAAIKKSFGFGKKKTKKY